MRGLTHEFAARLSAEEVLGVVQFFADPEDRSAEFAIAVRSDWKAHGLGHMLLAGLIQLARRRGIDELVGVVLAENAAMLRLCREVGFTVGFDTRDPKLRRVSKTLHDPRGTHSRL
jgi:acetyltransferase